VKVTKRRLRWSLLLNIVLLLALLYGAVLHLSNCAHRYDKRAFEAAQKEQTR